MADDNFGVKYTRANLTEGASPYGTELFAKWLYELQKTDDKINSNLASAILCAMLCAQRRGDAVGPLFNDSVSKKSQQDLEATFNIFREALLVTVGFVGLPSCMPAVFGLVAELKRRRLDDVPQVSPRKPFSESDWNTTGRDTNASIYRGVGNKEVMVMVNNYFPDFAHLSVTAIFGYALGGSSLFSLKEVEIIVASAIIASGATRQARSHVKAAMQLGNSVATLQAVVESAQKISEWSRYPTIQSIDVPALKVELDVELAKES